MDNYVDGYMFCAGNDGVFREYDRSLDLTINFENREAMEDFESWLKHEGAEAFEKWREKNGKEKKSN